MPSRSATKALSLALELGVADEPSFIVRGDLSRQTTVCYLTPLPPFPEHRERHVFLAELSRADLCREIEDRLCELVDRQNREHTAPSEKTIGDRRCEYACESQSQSSVSPLGSPSEKFTG